MKLGVQICSEFEWRSTKRILGIRNDKLKRQPFGECFEHRIGKQKNFGVKLDKLKSGVIHKKVGHHKITLSAKSIAHRALRKSSFFLAKDLSFIFEK